MAQRHSIWAAVGALVVAAASAWGDEVADEAAGPLDGRAVMERVDARPRGGDQRAETRWILFDKKGGSRTRETRTFWRDERPQGNGLHAKRLIVFEHPPELRETAFLVWSHLEPGKEDERWIYLSSLRKVRRVSSSDRGKAFMGTEFSFDDLADRSVDDDEHRLLRSEELAEVPHYVVESRPLRTGSPYERRVVYVSGDDFTETRIEYYDGKGLLKVLDARWQDVGGVPAWERLEMRNVRNGRRTEVELVEVEHGLGLEEDLFTESTLRFGVP